MGEAVRSMESLSKIDWISFKIHKPLINTPILVWNKMIMSTDPLAGYQLWFWDIASKELFDKNLLTFSHWAPLSSPSYEKKKMS